MFFFTHISFYSCLSIHPHPPVLPAAAIGCQCGPLFRSLLSPSLLLPTVASLSNKKQMGDLCCRLLPNGANSHYNVCKLCLFSPSFTSTLCTTLPSDVLNACFRMQTCQFDLPYFSDYRIFVIFSTNGEQASFFSMAAAYMDL